jgi:hypothetical protein
MHLWRKENGSAPHHFKKSCLLCTLLLLVLPGIVSGFSADDIRFPENFEIRLRLEDIIFSPAADLLSLNKKIYLQTGSEKKVMVESRWNKDSVYLLFVNERRETFPLFSKGSYIIKRNRKNGKFIQVKIFYRNDPSCFVRIFPEGSRALMDAYLEDTRIHENVVLPLSFEQIITASFSDIVEMSSAAVSWDLMLAEPYPEDYSALQSMVSVIRDRLSTLPDADDGAMDRNGDFVYIENLSLQDAESGFNCSGFVKWIADGMYRALTGTLLGIDELKEKHLSHRGNAWSIRYEDERDPYFGLDWSRNIAVRLMQADEDGELPDPEAADVKEAAFAEYIEDIGFPVPEIKTALFAAALKDPGYFYIGSLNREFGSDPPLHQHIHLAALFPYFDESGEFRLLIFERNRESSIESLVERYTNDYIHLVRIKAQTLFEPPEIE